MQYRLILELNLIRVNYMPFLFPTRATWFERLLRLYFSHPAVKVGCMLKGLEHVGFELENILPISLDFMSLYSSFID